jgi:hypothetical protein
VAWRFCRVEYSEAEDLSWQDSASTAWSQQLFKNLDCI